MAEQETVDKVIETLEGLGGQLQETTGQALEVYTYQAFIDGIYGTAWAGLFLLIFIISVIVCYRFTRKTFARDNALQEHIKSCDETYHSDSRHYEICPEAQSLPDADKPIPVAIIAGIATVLSLIIFALLADNVTQIINPEYHAIQELINQVR